MIHLDLLVWALGYPLISSIGFLLSNISRKIQGREPYDETIVGLASLMSLVFWVYGCIYFAGH